MSKSAGVCVMEERLCAAGTGRGPGGPSVSPIHPAGQRRARPSHLRTGAEGRPAVGSGTAGSTPTLPPAACLGQTGIPPSAFFLISEGRIAIVLTSQVVARIQNDKVC